MTDRLKVFVYDKKAFPIKSLMWNNVIEDWVEDKLFFTKNIKFMDLF
jgi:hypothetical protein